MHPSPIVSFRVPYRVLRRAFLLHSLFLLASMSLLAVFAQRASFAAMSGAIGLVVLSLVVAYAFTAHRIWFSASAEGLSTVGYTGRRVDLPWSTPISVKSARRSGLKGVILVPANQVGSLTAGLHAIFIPNAVAVDPEFKAVLAAFAPAQHPLRGLQSAA